MSKKVNLELLKKLVAELENHLNISDALNKAAPELDANQHEYIIEMSRAAGVASGIVSESTMLIGDIHRAVRLGNAPDLKDSLSLDKLLGDLTGVKGSSNKN